MAIGGDNISNENDKNMDLNNKADVDKEYVPYNFKHFSQMIQQELISKQSFSPYCIGNFTKEFVENALKCPEKNWKHLINISMYLCSVSGIYKSLILYMANMATFDGIVKKQILNIDSIEEQLEQFQKAYMDVNTFYNKTELKHEGNKVMSYVFRDGIYYGYAVESKNSFSFIRLPIEICSHCYMSDGTYDITIHLDKITQNHYKTLPLEIRKICDDYKNKKIKKTENTYEVDSKKGIVIKSDYLLPYSIPFFSHIFPDIYDLKDYKELKKDRAETDNYKLITFEIPVGTTDNEPDKLLLSDPIVNDTMDIAMNIIDNAIGVIPTPMKASPIQFTKSSIDNNHVKDATTYIYDNSSTNQLLFNGENSVALKYSLERDGSVIYSIYRQIERWYSRRFKLSGFNSDYINFKLNILDVTVYNKENYIKNELSLAQSSYPNKETLAVLHGENIQELIGQDLFENTIFKLGTTWTPLKTSYTQTGEESEGGAEEKDVGDLTDSGEQTREDDTNVRS